MSLNFATIENLNSQCRLHNARWIAVTKMRSIQTLKELYQNNIKIFGENKAQELIEKYHHLPKDIDWHFIGHLQTNKVKDIIDKVSTIHAVDSLKLLDTIQKEAKRASKYIKIFIQIHIAKEETKYGFSLQEAMNFFREFKAENYPNVEILGLMAMASFTDNQEQIRNEFKQVSTQLNQINECYGLGLKELSMGMSNDYKIALESGSTLLRIGSILYDK